MRRHAPFILLILAVASSAAAAATTTMKTLQATASGPLESTAVQVEETERLAGGRCSDKTFQRGYRLEPKGSQVCLTEWGSAGTSEIPVGSTGEKFNNRMRAIRTAQGDSKVFYVANTQSTFVGFCTTDSGVTYYHQAEFQGCIDNTGFLTAETTSVEVRDSVYKTGHNIAHMIPYVGMALKWNIDKAIPGKTVLARFDRGT